MTAGLTGRRHLWRGSDARVAWIRRFPLACPKISPKLQPLRQKSHSQHLAARDKCL